jgi:hypothetical protein
LDYCGPFRTTKAGNRYILTVCDYFTRWPILIPVPNQSASVLVDAFIEHVVSQHGVPKKLFSDRGKSFAGKFLKRLCDRMGIANRETTSYQPTSSGRVERFHSYLNAALTPFVDQNPDEWDRYLHLVAFPYRVSVLPGIGVSPFQLIYGRKLTLPMDLLTGGGPEAERQLQFDEKLYGITVTRKMSELYRECSQRDSKSRRKYALNRDAPLRSVLRLRGSNTALVSSQTDCG